MKRHLTICVFVIALLTLTITYIPVSAAQTDVSSPAQATTSELMAQAVQDGHVRVIVALNLPFQAETEISAAQASSQRMLIQQTQQQVSDLLIGTDAQTVATFETIPYLTLDADAAALQRLSDSGLVRQIIKENILRPLLAESVPHIGAPAAWTAGYDGTGQVVAVLDTGVDKNHSFLTGKVVSEACYSLSDDDHDFVPLCPGGTVTGGMSRQTTPGAAVPCTVEFCFHGTHVAGIAAGTGPTFSGVAKAAKIIAIQVFHRVDDDQVCSSVGFAGAPCVLSSDTEVLSGLERVYQLRSTYSIAAVNLSLGGGDFGAHCDLFFPYYYDMFAQLRSVGIAVVAGSGNLRQTGGIAAPACISNAISVGGTSDTSDAIWDDSSIFGASGSNSAAILDLLAPGENITSSVPGGGFVQEDGTSMATPHVAGALAVLRDAKPSATVDQMLTALQNTGVLVTDPENNVTTPRIQVDAAANALVASTLPTIGKIIINEIRVQSNQAVELFNAGTSAVNMTGWKFLSYAGNGNLETTYTFPSFTLNTGSYVILNKGTGSNSSTNLYMGNYTTAWASNGSGAAFLKSGNIGIDFVRWGTSELMPPLATGWSGGNPAGPPAGQNLGRDPITGDTDDGGDWSTQTASLGAVNQPTRPANDNFTNSILVANLPYNTTIATFTATRQTGEPNPTCAPDIGRTVWYRYTPTTSGLVGFDTIGSDFDTSMAVWTGSWGALAQVGCSEDITNGIFPQSKVVLNANAGTTYYIQVGGYNGLSGQLKFRIDVPMMNDEFSGAAIVASLPYATNQDTTTTTAAGDDPFPECNDDIRNTVWFRYTAAATETIRFETTGSDFDTVLSLWTGTQGNLTMLDCHDDQDPLFFTDITSLIDYPVVAGTTYHIMVSGGGFGASGNLIFKVKSMSPPPPGLNPPVLSTPTNGQNINTLTPSFVWFPAFNATSYQIQVGTNAALTGNPVTVVGTSYTLPSPLLTTTYYWRVRSLGTAGSMSLWSETRSLIVASAENAAPVQNFERTLPIRLTWAGADWAVQYEVQIDNERTFADPRLFNLFVSYTTPYVDINQLTNGVYYWRVRARDASNKWSGWSAIESFTFNN